ncbi:MAG: hypothetical protein QOH49_3538 [Acidobacteriota bacterium]|jgi:energy-coupling factor transporter ATP-binding protein EcfA2|nr:hypothetical protein [Acidobacteriota bacterium]
MSSQLPTIFISYAREDAAHKERLLVHLQGLIQRGVISAWHDGLLVPGQQWSDEIVNNLKAARVVVLLVSPDFIASAYVERVELMHAARRRAQGPRCVVPVLVEHVHGWEDKPLGDSTLGDLQALPDGGRFVVDWEDINAAWENVVAGIKKTLDACAEPEARTDWRVRIPDPPAFGVVPRRDRDRRDIVSHLVEELAPGRGRRVMLSGPSGMGKKTLAAEVARTLLDDYGGRVVWSDAAGRVQYTEPHLYEDIAVKLGNSKPHRWPFDRNRADAEARLAGQPLLVILDSFEAVRPAERRHIQQWLGGTPCSALFVSREIDDGLNLHTVSVGPMEHDEALEMFRRLVAETQSPRIFTDEVRDGILHAACGHPVALKLIMSYINLTQRPAGVLEQLRRNEGEVTGLVIEIAFNLPQLGPDGQAVLLGLSLFTPRATHEALAYVAGFGRGPRALRRLDKAVANLTRLSLLMAGDEGGRLGLENFVRRRVRVKFDEDNRTGRFEWLPGPVRPLFLWFLTAEGPRRHFKRRFIEYFREHTVNFKWADYAECTVAKAERSNVVAAMQFACERQDWDTVLELFAVTLTYINTYTVWRKSIVAAEREVGDRLLKTGRRPPLLIEINHRRENKRAARRYYEGIPEKVGVPGVATHTDLLGLDLTGVEIPREEWWRLVVLSVAAFELGVCAYSRGKYPLARGYFEAAKKLKKKFKDYGGYGIACNGLGVALAVEGQTGRGVEGWKLKALDEFKEARKNFEGQREKAVNEQRWEDAEKFAKFEKVADQNKEWLEGLKG